MKNNHWRSFKKGMSWFLTFAIAIGSQGTGLSAATLDYGQDYQVSVSSDVDTSQTQQIPASDGEGDTTQVEDSSASGSDVEDTSKVEDISIPDSEEDPAQVEDVSTSYSEEAASQVEDSSAQDSEGNTSQIEDAFTDGEGVPIDNNEEIADTTLLDAPADVKEGTIQYLIEEARKAGSTTLTISLGEDFPATVEENLLIPRGMDIVLDLNGHTLTVDKSSAEAGKDTNNITVYGQFTLKNGSLSGSASSAGNENTRGVFVCYGGRLILGEGSQITGYSASGRGGGLYVSDGAGLSMNGGRIYDNCSGISGGGVWIYRTSNLSYENGTITGNKAALNGGGVYIQKDDSETITWGSGIAVTENHADRNGGGLYIHSVSDVGNELIFDGLTISQNTAGVSGGGIQVQDPVHFTMVSGEVSYNQAVTHGGGLYLNSTDKKLAQVSLTGGTIQGNTLADDVFNYYDSGSHLGGGMWISNYANVVLAGVQILDNETVGTGGGIAMGNYCQVQIREGTLVHGNKSWYHGGGIYGVYANVEMTGGEISDNQATGGTLPQGGGFFLNAGKLIASGGSICRNYAESYGGGGFISTVILSGDVTVADNKTGGHGGGIFGSVTMSDQARIQGNTSGYGGGVNGTLVMNGGFVCGNTVSGWNGGGGAAGTVTLNEGEISGNYSTGVGGGVRGTLYMNGGVIKDNTADGGGGALYGAGTLSSGEITNNQSASTGGCAYLAENGRNLTITGDVQIHKNRAVHGGAVSLVGGTVQISGGVISENQANRLGGGVYVWTSNALNPTITIEKEAVISDNQASGTGTAPGGQDLYVAATLTVNNGSNPVYYTPVVSLPSADQMTSATGTSGIAWYDEADGTKNTTGLQLDTAQRTKIYQYTFLYSDPEAKTVARLDDSQEYATVQAAVDAAGDGQLHRITLLKEDQESVQIPKGTSICFDLNGNTIRGSGKTNTPVFTVKGEMTLEDSSEDQTGYIIGGTPAADGRGGCFYLERGSLVMNGGTIGPSASGSGIYVKYKDSSFVMNGGRITKNKASAVSVYQGSFRMTGGEITGNSADHGGGIYAWGSASINIEGGKITGNTAACGGGIRIRDHAVCHISGGEISGNATSNASSSWGGGGIAVSWASLYVTGGTITDNTTSGLGGGIRADEGSTVSVTGGTIYGNQWTFGKSDLYATKGVNLTLLSASAMKPEAYNCWYDCENDQVYPEEIRSASLEQPCNLYAWYKEELTSSDAAQILDESGQEHNFPSVQEAVQAAADGQRIYLLKDCDESVQIGKDKNVILDLNGYTLCSSQENVLDVRGKLEVDSTTANIHTNPDQDGRIQPAEGVAGNRGVFVREGGAFTLKGGVLTGFSGVKYGGGIYADQNASVTISGGEITGNQAVYGGGIAFYSIRSNTPSSFTMTGGKIRNNQSEKDGGGVYMGRPFNLANQIRISGGEICENTAGGHGGGVSADFTQGSNTASQILISGGKIHHNTAATDGAGVYIQNCKTVVIGPDLEVSYNKGAGSGGGIRAVRVTELTVENIDAHHNQAKSGGGLSLSAGELLVKDCKIHHNSTRPYGGYSYSGGASFNSTKKLEIKKGEFYSNGAYNGGGMSVSTDAGGQAVIGKNVWIHDNKATEGGGLRIDSVGKLTVNGLVENNSASTGGGIRVASNSSEIHFADVTVQNNKATGSGGGIYLNDGNPSKVYLEDPARILGNTASSGGGIGTRLSQMILSGGVIADNKASNLGGGVYLDGHRTWGTHQVQITGDVQIINNQALNGGGVGCSENTVVTMDGGRICNNKATYGGGVWVSAVKGGFILKKPEEAGSTAKLYGNQAGYGRDVCGNYDKAYKNSKVQLFAAAHMFGADEDKDGSCWYNETKNTSITDPIDYDPVTTPCYLTLQYTSKVPVAKIKNEAGTYDAYTSLQQAVNAVKAGKYKDVAPEIFLIKDINESIQVPGGVSAVLNLNGHKLQGTDTAITCSGDLRILDEKTEGLDPGEETGTISGSTDKIGGGILVLSGGCVTMESGQISMCSAPTRQSDRGGAGVAVSGGTFILDNTASINECVAAFGAAVFVGTGSSLFEMRGGTICNNAAKVIYNSGSGIIYSTGGTVRISGGRIADNVVGDWGTIYLTSGKCVLEGGEITGNQARYGGGFYIGGAASVWMSNTQISNNQATVNGGAIYNEGQLHILDGTKITGNQAVYGGAIYQTRGTIKMAGGSVTGNQAEKGGGLAQNPQVGNAGSFVLSGGLLCENKSTVDGTGNDIFSLYEGTGNYENVSVNQKPSVTLIQAAAMTEDNGNVTKYNAWRNDTYQGNQLEGTDVTNGYYITGGVDQSNNLKLTAVTYKEAEVKGPDSTVQVKSIGVKTTKNEDGTSDGGGVFDTECAGDEKTAQQLLDEGDSQTYESQEKITEGETQEQMTKRHHYLYNGDILKMICHDGKWYERDQAVMWSPGNDSSYTNGIVRSFDTVKYNLRFTLEDIGKDEEDEGNQEGTPSVTDDTLQLWVEMKLPVDSSLASFSEMNMKYHHIYEQKQADGSYAQYLRGYWELEENKGGTVYRTLAISVKGMNNGDLLKPSFTAWVGGNEEDEQNPKSCSSKTLTVSAAPRYNVLLKRNSQLAYTSYFDMESGEETTEEEVKKLHDEGKDTSHIVYGTMLGYGITLQMYNNKTNKGIRGLQVPTGDIQFDVSFGGELVMNGSSLGENLAPYAWAYKANENGATGNSFTDAQKTVNVDWNDEDDYNKTTTYGWDAAPYNTGNSATGCYSGGFWKGALKQRNETGDKRLTLHFTVSNYSVASSTPSATANGSWDNQVGRSGYINSFSAGYVQVLYPFDKAVAAGQSGYLEINMECAASDLNISSVTGLTPESTENGLDAMESFFGENYKNHAVHEMNYMDNYLNHSTGLYIYGEGGNGDHLSKTNYFSKETGTDLISTSEGTGSTPLGSQVYIDADVSFSSKEYYTDDVKDPHYIPPDKFDPQVDNLLEYNYLTGVNLLQKFDSDAYTPACGEKIIDRQVNQGAGSNWNWVGKSAGTNSTNAFLVGTSESATTWSSSGNLKTKSFKLTVLYGAKPDGTNWNKTETADGLTGGEEEMDAYTEEELIYFTSLDELKAYFAAKGNLDGRCVALLYEVRDCCIRTGRSLYIRSRMQMTKDFAKTGGTYCTTNDVRGWTTYRPTYKRYYNDGKRDAILFSATWRSRKYGTADGIVAYGNGDTGGPLPDGYVNTLMESQDSVMKYTKQRCDFTFNGYKKTEYQNGVKKNGTHVMGWMAGNTLLLYTLVSEIGVKNTDLIKGSNREKTYYNVSDGERTANFMVMPRLQISSATKDHELVANGSQATDVVITMTIPKDLHYNKGSLQFDYSAPGNQCKYKAGDLAWDVKQTDNPDGTTTLTLCSTVSDINKGLPYIRYNCTIGKKGADENEDVKDNQQLTTKVQIHTTYEEIHRITGQANSAEQTIIATRTNDDAIYKETDRDLIEIGDDLIYYLNYSNHTENLNPIQLCDILPANGDGRNSSFHGGYRVKEIYLDFTREADRQAFLDGSAGQLKYRKGGISAKDLTQDERTLILNTINNGKWFDLASSYESSEYTENGVTMYRLTCRADANGRWAKGEELIHYADGNGTIDAIYGFVPQVSEKGNFQMGLVFTPFTKDNATLLKSRNITQQGGDVYNNSFFYRSGGLTSQAPTVSSSVEGTRIAKRKIAGLVWLDQDQNGNYRPAINGYSTTDRLLSKVDVYLYQESEPFSSKITKNPDGSFSQVIGGKTRTMSATTVDGKILYPAVDVMGNLLDKVVTGSDGAYAFENLAEGSYYIVLQDEGDDYAVTGGTRVLPFERLSITPEREDTKNTLTQPGRDTDKALPEYQDTDTADQGAAAMKRTVIANNGSGITLPGLTNMVSWEYVTNHWDCGLYYLDLSLEKNWAQTTSIPDQASVLFEITGSTGTGEDAVSYPAATYTAKIASGRVTAKAEGMARPYSKTEGAPSQIPTTVAASQDKGNKTMRWLIQNQPMQAEGANGVIRYDFKETAKDGEGNSLPGFVMTRRSDSTAEDQTRKFAVWNTQINYEICLGKKGSEGELLSNAVFTLYKDKDCRVPAGITMKTDQQGNSTVTGLEAGTGAVYYVKETKAPSGYFLNKGILKLTIAYKDKTKYYDPTISLERITDEITGDPLDPAADLDKMSISCTVDDSEKDPDSLVPEVPLKYSISFELTDSCIYSLPKTGGRGIWWEMLFGTGMMLTAVYLYSKKRRNLI